MSESAAPMTLTRECMAEETEKLRTDMVALHRATLSLFSDLSLEGVLRRVIHAARDLVNARYAALGIPDDQGRLETFITLGMTREEMERIPHQPRGEGLLGEMLRTGKSIRIPEISEHPKSVGFPPGHPEMHSFLGVPISAYGKLLGQIYLTDKQDAPAFTLEDQQLIEMLAAHAAAAIENARLYQKVLASEEELSRRNQELGLMYSLATAAGMPLDLDRLLADMLERVRSLFRARAGEIYLMQEAEGTYYRALHLGDSVPSFWTRKQFRLGEGLVGEVAKVGKPRWIEEIGSDTPFIAQPLIGNGLQTLVCVPLSAAGKVVGVLCLAFREKRRPVERDVGLLGAVGAGVGIAVENARLYRQAQRLAILEERERIGMDLHDGIIQSIYAVGLTLDYARLTVGEQIPEARQRLDQAIESLNQVIRDLRSYILDLQPSKIRTQNIEKALHVLVQEFKANTLVDADLRVEAEAAAKLLDHKASELLHIAQEALANAAKHAQASRVLVSLRQSEPETITLQVIDNGRGFDVDREPELIGHGLSNMAERARQIQGEFLIVSSPGQGTTVTVRLPTPSGTDT
ncbi:MAG TPA: GAF domain-containing protein [Chloroflexi bacterium]|nr:GAF domain-containing protein [Chloroflexota bacterium]